MKFCKKYEEYMEGEKHKRLPSVGFKKLKKILKRCRKQLHPHTHDSSACPYHCPVCDGTFFPSLLEEMSAVVTFFNSNAKKLLERHLASGFRKIFILLRNKLKGNRTGLIQEGRDLVAYAVINAIAMRKILKKYDKIHCSKNGQAFRSKVQSMHVEILQSPWLCELIAFQMNFRKKAPAISEGCFVLFSDGRPSLRCELFDSVSLDIDLTCSVCLAASVTIVDGLKAANHSRKCPICRESGVYEAAVNLEELQLLLSRSCPEYWEERRQDEKRERVQQAKEHWELQCRLFMGV